MNHSHRARPSGPRLQQHCLRAGVLAAITACLLLGPHDQARAATGVLGVTAHVAARTLVETTTAPAVLAITADDVQRGWVQVSEPLVLTVRSNARKGPALIISSAGDLVKGGVLTGFSDPVGFGPGQATIQLAAQRPGDQVRYLLTVRLLLAAGVRPGEYAFPMRFDSADGETVSSALP